MEAINVKTFENYHLDDMQIGYSFLPYPVKGLGFTRNVISYSHWSIGPAPLGV